MENKTLRTALIAFVAVVLIACSFGGGFAAGHFLPIGNRATQVTATAGGNQGGTPQNVQTLFEPFWQAWDLIHKQYVDQPVNDTTLMQGAINGMMQSLGDAHTIYLDPQAYKEAMSQIQGQYTGIGALVDTTGKLLTITRFPAPNTPAQNAGLQPGDQVIAVDGQDVTSLDPESVRQKVLGPAGTTVHLTIQRPGTTQPLEFSIVRAVIVVPSVISQMLPDQIAYIQLTIFGDTTADDLHKALATLMAQNPKGLILDLRDNPGGNLDTAISVASEFISSGVIVSEKESDGSITPHNARPGGLATQVPLVVLVNENSASASEIVAGAIQDTGRGKLVGVTTYGKGSVQIWNPLMYDQGSVNITVARWLTPKGNTIDKKGLTPDVVVTMTTDDVKAGRDPQKDAAVKLLLTPSP